MLSRCWSRFLLLSTTALAVRAFLPQCNAPAGANKNHCRVGNDNDNKKSSLLRRRGKVSMTIVSSAVMVVAMSSTTSNTRSVAPKSAPPPPLREQACHDADTAMSLPFKWLERATILPMVLARIVGASLHPQMWKGHFQKSHKWVLVALCVAQVATVSIGGLLSTAVAVQVVGAVILWRCYLLPAAYAILLAFCWTYLCHDGHVGRMLHDVYVLAPWWFSNKLLATDDAEARVPDLLRTLRVDAGTVQVARAFAQAREPGGYDIRDASILAHHSGVLVLYVHAFGSAVMSSPDWPHVVMHCCYGRILDDYQDLEEDIRDGNVDRNFFLRFQQQQQHSGVDRWNDHFDDDDATTTTTRTLVVQAMRAIHWHQEQMKDPHVQQYARGVTQSLEVMMVFKSPTFKRDWQEARAEASAKTNAANYVSPWPFQSLIPIVPATGETVALAGRKKKNDL
jgi:hypothetical protein